MTQRDWIGRMTRLDWSHDEIGLSQDNIELPPKNLSWRVGKRTSGRPQWKLLDKMVMDGYRKLKEEAYGQRSGAIRVLKQGQGT